MNHLVIQVGSLFLQTMRPPVVLASSFSQFVTHFNRGDIGRDLLIVVCSSAAVAICVDMSEMRLTAW